MSLGLGSYIKDMKNVIAHKEGSILSIANTEEWEEELATGTGEAYGVELDIRRRFGKINGWINYTYSKSTRRFEDLNQGNPFPASFNRLHSIKMNWLYQITNNAEFTFNWTYDTGLLFTSPVAFFPYDRDDPIARPSMRA